MTAAFTPDVLLESPSGIPLEGLSVISQGIPAAIPLGSSLGIPIDLRFSSRKPFRDFPGKSSSDSSRKS